MQLLEHRVFVPFGLTNDTPISQIRKKHDCCATFIVSASLVQEFRTP